MDSAPATDAMAAYSPREWPVKMQRSEMRPCSRMSAKVASSMTTRAGWENWVANSSPSGCRKVYEELCSRISGNSGWSLSAPDGSRTCVVSARYWSRMRLPFWPPKWTVSDLGFSRTICRMETPYCSSMLRSVASQMPLATFDSAYSAMPMPTSADPCPVNTNAVLGARTSAVPLSTTTAWSPARASTSSKNSPLRMPTCRTWVRSSSRGATMPTNWAEYSSSRAEMPLAGITSTTRLQWADVHMPWVMVVGNRASEANADTVWMGLRSPLALAYGWFSGGAWPTSADCSIL